MAMTSDDVTNAVNAAFADGNEFASMLKMLAGVGARVKLEIQRDALYRQIQDAQAELTARQNARQTENITDAQQTQAAVNDWQAQAAALQAQIDSINAGLPNLLK
jgi:hypothetical protein